KISTPEHNYIRDGFHARTRAEEIKSTDLELNVLISIENVTDRVNAAVTPGASAAEAYAQRRAVIATIEKDSLAKTGLRSDVVTLYQGAEYHLYRYKRYTDVRLVFAVEQQAAFFGGDPDNFEFPRYNLDISLFRAYENGQPAKITDYLKVSPRGAAENELVFVSGNPGATDRLLTVAELAAHRDSRVPMLNAYLKNNEVALAAWSARSEENARRAQDDFLSFQNSRKVYDGRRQTLYDPAFFQKRISEEAALQSFAHSRSDLTSVADAWARVASAQAALTENYKRQVFLESRDPTRWPLPTFESDLLRYGRLLYRLPSERAKPNGDRLREYRDSAKETLELDLFSEQPIYRDLEKLKLTQFLTLMVEQLGADDPAVQRVLAGQSPARRAAQLIDGTKLVDVSFRRKLAVMSTDEIEHVDDPVITLMRTIDADARAARRIFEEQTNAKAQAHADVAKVLYAKYGDSRYPDATFTLRLSYGTIKGYDEDTGHVAPFTDLAGMFQRSAEHHGREPFDLPPHWESFEKNWI
ncbi:MAG TPA: S46 family peptidase, partial [Opitutaceae bacterium]